MTPPRRVQLQRTRGWRKPDNTVVVARPSLWGNPWSLHSIRETYGLTGETARRWAVERYRRELEHFGLLADYGAVVSEAKWNEAWDLIRVELEATSMADAAPRMLGGKNLACWCPLDQPCHADVLLELANKGVRP